MITLETNLARIRGLSESFITKLAKLNIITVKDLLWHFPYRYDDFSKTVKIADLQPNQSATISGVVKKVETRRTWHRKMIVVEALIVDDTGGIKALWFNQPYIGKILKPETYFNFAGKVVVAKGDVYLSNPAYEPAHGPAAAKHTGGLIPVYPETRGLTSRGLRYLVKPLLLVLPPLQDFIPENILISMELPNLDSAVKKIHFPKQLSEAELAKKRFAFQDLFLLQLNNLKLRSRLAREKAPPLNCSESDLREIIAALPFELTPSQLGSFQEILADISRNQPMNRILQGDVGSGKTVIVAMASLIAARNNLQTAFMAPTEVLARQHFQTFEKIFNPLLKRWGIHVGLLISGLDAKLKKHIKDQTVSGGAHIIIGTHALIEKNVSFKNLGLVIIDEQHRFGVEQRATLIRNHARKTEAPTSVQHQHAAGEKNFLIPHFLSMSATPIPRTLSLTLFGDLDLSIISELPKGRKAIITKVVDPANRAKAYEFIRAHIKNGRQAFVVCPRIEASQNSDSQESEKPAQAAPDKRKNLWLEVKNVTEEYLKLSKNIFPDLRIAMMHGKLKSKDKEKIMNDFKSGAIDILVSTSVIEVGVDVPNASIMIIEGAELFGLAQLYQFRGRIGRGEHQSFCLLFTNSSAQTGNQRLQALIKAKNGFELAELDLQLRGPGQFLGDQQTGLPDLAMNSLNNMELIKMARQAAGDLIGKDAELTAYPALQEKLIAFQKNIHLE